MMHWRRRKSRTAARERLGIVAPRLRIADLATEAIRSVIRHPARCIVVALGTVLGTAAFVSTLGITSTIQHQVADSFDVRRATEVLIRPEQADLAADWQSPAGMARLRGLNGVIAAGRRINVGQVDVRRSLDGPARPVSVYGADPGALAAMAPNITQGRTYGDFHEARAARVVLLPRSVAEALMLTRTGVAVFINDQAFTVIGFFDDVQRRPETLLGMLMPASTAETLVTAGSTADRDVVVETAPGAAQLIGGQAALALWPQAPAALRVIAPPDPRTLRRDIEGNIARSTLLLSLVSLVVGAVSIANASMAAIGARTSEIGLRRAVGAGRVHVFAQLLTETTALGAVGGFVGGGLGVMVTAVVSLTQLWVPVIDLGAAGQAVLIGGATGLVAGMWPAARAVAITPVAALQR